MKITVNIILLVKKNYKIKIKNDGSIYYHFLSSIHYALNLSVYQLPL